MIKVGVIAVCDFESLPVGGEVSLLNRLCSVDNESLGMEYDLIGMSFSDEEVGRWGEKRINGRPYRWLPVSSYRKNIPLRVLMARGVKRFVHLLENRSYDVLYIHSPELYLPVAHMGVPVVYHVHGDPYYTVRMSRFPLLRMGPFVRYYDRLIESALRGSESVIWAARRSMCEFLDKEVFLKDVVLPKVEVIHSCYGEKMRLASGDVKEKFSYRFVTVGRLAKVKHVDFLIRVFARIAEKHPESVFYICGDGEEREFLEALSDELGCSDEVVFLGALDNESLGRCLNESDIFLFASESEAMSLVVLESLSCGVPVVSTDVGDLSEVVLSEETGMLLPDRDENEFVLAVERLKVCIDNYDVNRKCRKIAEKYSPNEMASSIARKLNEVCKKESVR